MRVRIGIADTARELELDVDDADEFIGDLEAAYAKGDALLWVEDTGGHRVGVPLSRLGFVEFEPEHKVSVGFAPGG